MPRILVVDDEPLISMLVEDWLTELGCEVVGPVLSVADGIEFATAAALDGAILDIRLGDGDSYPLAHALLSRGIPFAFATGQGDDSLDSDFENHSSSRSRSILSRFRTWWESCSPGRPPRDAVANLPPRNRPGPKKSPSDALTPQTQYTRSLGSI